MFAVTRKHKMSCDTYYDPGMYMWYVLYDGWTFICSWITDINPLGFRLRNSSFRFTISLWSYCTWTQRGECLFWAASWRHCARPSQNSYECLQTPLPALLWHHYTFGQGEEDPVKHGSFLRVWGWLRRRGFCIWRASAGGRSVWSGNITWESGFRVSALCVRRTARTVMSVTKKQRYRQTTMSSKFRHNLWGLSQLGAWTGSSQNELSSVFDEATDTWS